MGFATLVETVFVLTGVAHGCAVVLLAVDVRSGRAARRGAAIGDPIGCFAVAAALAVLTGRDVTTVAATAGAAAAIGMLITCLAPDFRPAGALAWATVVSGTVAGSVVGFVHLSDFSTGAIVAVPMWLVAVMGVLRTPSSLMQLFEGWEVALRHRWRRTAIAPTDRSPIPNPPMVTIQVPIHSEPPGIVIDTLDALARLDYPRFEVLVIDNNTRQENLWRPVEAHCARLGPRFRFLHVEGITGAKAGALNWARPSLDPRTELVALVDADYQVEPRWLADTVPLFADPRLGFVQCPHAYRDFRHSTYGRMANTGYRWAQVTEMVSRDEHGAGITVGTMSLIRLETLDKAGGWAEWCQTEDSEFAIRAHAAGYGSVLLDRAYGRGLIPETLSELKKQRYRWTYGPGQEFKAHVRLFLPGRLGAASALTRGQRIRHGHYGLVVLTAGFGVLSLPMGVVLLCLVFGGHEMPDLGPELLLPFGALLIGRRVMRWILFTTAVGADFRDFVGGCVALLAVKPTMSSASFGVLIGKPTQWRRTDKFHAEPAGFRCLRDARTEIVLGLGCLSIAVATPIALPVGVPTVLFTLGFGWQAMVYACAPLLAVLAERDLRTRPAASAADPRPAAGDPAPTPERALSASDPDPAGPGVR
ncbi:glycosyltransferase [Embleya sp. NPDC001921]